MYSNIHIWWIRISGHVYIIRYLYSGHVSKALKRLHTPTFLAWIGIGICTSLSDGELYNAQPILVNDFECNHSSSFCFNSFKALLLGHYCVSWCFSIARAFESPLCFENSAFEVVSRTQWTIQLDDTISERGKDSTFTSNWTEWIQMEM